MASNTPSIDLVVPDPSSAHRMVKTFLKSEMALSLQEIHPFYEDYAAEKAEHDALLHQMGDISLKIVAWEAKSAVVLKAQQAVHQKVLNSEKASTAALMADPDLAIVRASVQGPVERVMRDRAVAWLKKQDLYVSWLRTMGEMQKEMDGYALTVRKLNLEKEKLSRKAAAQFKRVEKAKDILDRKDAEFNARYS